MAQRVLIIGKGAREHALAYRLSKDAQDVACREVFVCPGNDGIRLSFDCIEPAREPGSILEIAKKLAPDLIVIGPEEPLSMGLADALRKRQLPVFGPSQAAARLESSKAFMKEVAQKAQIPTAAHKVFSNFAQAKEFILENPLPLVIKADGLCAGKGVRIATTHEEALATAAEFLGEGSAPKFNDASKTIVVESFLEGQEVSVIGLCDGDNVLLFAPVRDHKRLLEQDEGPNTGGMGVIGPIHHNQSFMDEVRDRIFLPALSYMRRMGHPFKGALFAGLMCGPEGIKLLEFNVRLGDPEAQALLFGTPVDLFEPLHKIATQEKLDEAPDLLWSNMQPTAAITMAARGYPQAPVLGDVISWSQDPLDDDQNVFFAGVRRTKEGLFVTDGGRVLSCVARAGEFKTALAKSYDILNKISFNGAQYRKDIGASAL